MQDSPLPKPFIRARARRSFRAPAPRFSRFAPLVWAAGLLTLWSSTVFAAAAVWDLAATLGGWLAAGPPLAAARPAQAVQPEPARPADPEASAPALLASVAGEGAPRVVRANATSPAEGSAAPAPVETEGDLEADLEDGFPEYTWTECKGVFVYIVTTFEEEPSASAASLARSPTAPGRFRRVGQSFGDWELLWIADDWSGVNPAVWLRRDREVCRAELAGNPARARAAALAAQRQQRVEQHKAQIARRKAQIARRNAIARRKALARRKAIARRRAQARARRLRALRARRGG